MPKHNDGVLRRIYGDMSVSNPDGLESYELKHVIGRGSNCTAYFATCTRGRLRGRDVALKVAHPSLPTHVVDSLCSIAALQKSLHHPSIVSLHSTFATADGHYFVLELCEGGTLSSFLNTRSKKFHGNTRAGPFGLTESQLRPVLRSVVEGLCYLHAHGITHRNLDPEGIYITLDGRAKLGGFGICAFNDKSIEEFQWYLGSLVVTLITGSSPFNTASAVSYKIPAQLSISTEAENMIYGLLKVDPHERLPLDKILTHPFFQPPLPTELLHPAPVENINLESPASQETPPSSEGENPDGELGLHAKTTKPQHCPYPTLRTTVTSTVDFNPSIPLKSRPVFRPRLISSQTATSSGIREAWTKLTNRQQSPKENKFSDSIGPQPETEHISSLEEKRKVLREMGNLGSSSPATPKPLASCEQGAFASGLLSPPETPCDSDQPNHRREALPAAPSRSPPPIIAASKSSRRCSPSWGNNIPITYSQLNDALQKPIPRTNVPNAFPVPPLFPQTHKIAHGQLVVMSSRSLLVDLREGERRAGGKGDTVLCISPDGREIQIYDAPHLSTPCVLSESLSTWNIDELPERYWESYNFASKFVESVKKRTAWMSWSTPQAKFNLMSNSPKGDLHATFPCPPPCPPRKRHSSRDGPTDSFTKMKVKLSREKGVVEISRFVSSRGGGEWSTRFLNATEEQLNLGADSGLELTPEEYQGLNCVVGALKVCEVAEDLYMNSQAISAEEKDGESEDAADLREKSRAPQLMTGSHTRRSLTDISASTGLPTVVSVSHLSITPRPRRVSSVVNGRACRGNEIETHRTE